MSENNAKPGTSRLHRILSLPVRLGVLAVVAAIAILFTLPEETRNTILLRGGFMVGFFAPVPVVAVVAGWVTLSWKWAKKAALIVLGIELALLVAGPFIFDTIYKKQYDAISFRKLEKDSPEYKAAQVALKGYQRHEIHGNCFDYWFYDSAKDLCSIPAQSSILAKPAAQPRLLPSPWGWAGFSWPWR